MYKAPSNPKEATRNCAVLVNSCDRYKEAWDPFFSLFFKFWPSCPFKVYLNTETESYNEYGVITLNSDGNWGQRLSSVLEKINASYVIFLLEDFFLQQTVKENVILTCLKAMEHNPLVGCFYYNRISGYVNEKDNPYDGFIRMLPTDVYNEYIANCQAALWRKDLLLVLANNASSPWEFEIDSYKKHKDLLDSYEMYCLYETRYDMVRECDVFSYVLDRDTGYGIWASKWLWNNKRMFKRFGINVKYQDLKVMTRSEFVLKYKLKPFFISFFSKIKNKLHLFTQKYIK